MRPKAKFLTVVWGDAYIRRFATLALPSFVAPGNLPALARATDLEVVIMTRAGDFDSFEQHASFHQLREICAVRFVAIDDLITTGVYGVTLTLAYARPIIALGEEMVRTHFVFMNADFVLADGSLASLARHILAGRSIVLGPSFRATAEAVEPRLKRAVDPRSGVLAMPPRQMAALSLAHPHPTTIAKTLNQNFCHSTHPNQFFWQVDAQTVLGRYYLIFMLCLKPERVVHQINSYCDYAFIPELCPSGDEVAMGDSDEFFMLEMQDHDQELHMLKIGRQAESATVASLAEWTTAEHRRAASHDILFHAGDVPPGVEAARAEARAFVERNNGQLGPPVSHAGHFYWTSGVKWWKHCQALQGLSNAPPELAPVPERWPVWHGFARRARAAAGGLVRRVVKPPLSRLRSRFVGRVPKVMPLHPYWLDYRLLQQVCDAAFADPAARVLVVRDRAAQIDPLLPDGRADVMTLGHALGGSPRQSLPQGALYDRIVVYLMRRECRSIRHLVRRFDGLLAPGGTCEVFLHHFGGELELSDFSAELVRYVDAIVGTPPRPAQCRFVGGRLVRKSRRLLMRIRHRYARAPAAGVFWVPVALGFAMAFLLLTHFRMRNRLPSAAFVPHCSSMAVRFDARDAPVQRPAPPGRAASKRSETRHADAARAVV
jgi:hypothetical protein